MTRIIIMIMARIRIGGHIKILITIGYGSVVRIRIGGPYKILTTRIMTRILLGGRDKAAFAAVSDLPNALYAAAGRVGPGRPLDQA